MGWPQITYIVLSVLSLGYILAKDGQPREPYSFWGSCIGTSIGFGLLYAGGFFSQ